MAYDDEEHNPRLKGLILEMVDNQIRDNNPPITKITLDRLMSAGYSKQQAKAKIGAMLTEQICDIMTYSKSFDEKWYEKHLSGLK